jgi:hypothetical protein
MGQMGEGVENGAGCGCIAMMLITLVIAIALAVEPAIQIIHAVQGK